MNNISLEYRMAVSQWSNFANYNVGDQVQNGSSVRYGCILANTNQPPPNVVYWNDLTPVASGIASLQALTEVNNGGNIVLTSPTATYTTNPGTGEIDMVIAFPSPPPAPTTTYASFYSSTTQALASGAETILTYDAKSIGTGNITPVGGVYPATGIVVADAGIYKFLFSIQVDRAGGGNGVFQAYIKVGGVAVPDTNTQIVVNQNTQTLNTCEFILSLIAGAVIEVGCWSNSAGQEALAIPISGTTPVAVPSIISNIYRLE